MALDILLVYLCTKKALGREGEEMDGKKKQGRHCEDLLVSLCFNANIRRRFKVTVGRQRGGVCSIA